jgi:hypothetical protein
MKALVASRAKSNRVLLRISLDWLRNFDDELLGLIGPALPGSASRPVAALVDRVQDRHRSAGVGLLGTIFVMPLFLAPQPR